MNKIRLNRADLARVSKIVEENELVLFELVCNDSNGIGYTLDLVFDWEINGRDAKVTIPVITTNDW